MINNRQQAGPPSPPPWGGNGGGVRLAECALRVCPPPWYPVGRCTVVRARGCLLKVYSFVNGCSLHDIVTTCTSGVTARS